MSRQKRNDDLRQAATDVHGRGAVLGLRVILGEPRPPETNEGSVKVVGFQEFDDFETVGHGWRLQLR